MDKQTKDAVVGDIFLELNEIEKIVSKDNDDNVDISKIKTLGSFLTILCC